MQYKYTRDKWSDLYRKCRTREERDKLTGIPIKLAARVLKVSRSRVHQLLKEDKPDTVDVYDEYGARVGHLVTLASLDERRRTVKSRPTQWKTSSKCDA